MKKHDIIVIGSSAGGVFALKELVGSLPEDFPAAIFIVQHVAPNFPSFLPAILGKGGKLKATHPQDGEPIRAGHIYIAPPDFHMLIENDCVLVRRGPKENRFRPSIDALFRSAAYNYGSRVIGVVLTGMLDDGSSGMWSVKRLGGLGIIQQPEDAKYPSMPQSVLDYVDVDYIVPLSDLGKLLSKLVQVPTLEMVPSESPDLERMKVEIDTAAQRNAFEEGIMEIGELSPLTCPECNGVLLKLKEGNLIRYRCHTGHSYQATSLLTGITEAVEMKLWEALKSLEERVMLLEDCAKENQLNKNASAAEDLAEKAEVARVRAKRLREFLFE